MYRAPIQGLPLAHLLVIPVSAATRLEVSTVASDRPTSNIANVHDFHFGDGKTLKSVRLRYMTLGKPLRDASGAITNGVLPLHGTAGSAAHLVTAGFFIAPHMEQLWSVKKTPAGRNARFHHLGGLIAEYVEHGAELRIPCA